MRKTLFLFALILVGAIYASAQPQGQEQEAKDIFVKAYRIGPGDLLEIKVFEIEQLNQVVRVSENQRCRIHRVAAALL